jgi:hypothetical protein
MKRRNGRHGAGRRLASGALPCDHLTPVVGSRQCFACGTVTAAGGARASNGRNVSTGTGRSRALLEAALKKLGGGLAMTTTRLIVAALLLALAAPLTAEAQQTFSGSCQAICF